jgi:hypothetical protein
MRVLLKRRPFIGWLIIYSALAIAVTFPLVLRLTTTVAADLDDPLLSTSLLWWNAHVLPLTERWWNGFAFFPARGMMAFSDHRLGESLIAAPLQWLGCSPSAAYNLTLLATFPLCAIAAHALGFVLTKRHDAAALCGLVYGFNPFRASHIAHLELLAAFGMPLALAALHLAATTRRPRWIVAFAGALVVQGLCASYYLAFFAVLLLLWVLWFMRRRDIWLLFGMAGAGACLVAVLLPLALGFARVHRFYGMSRDIGTVRAFSADVNSLLTATRVSALWGWTAGLSGGEGQLFPGLVAPVLILVSVVVAIRRRRVPRDRWDWAVVGFGAVAAVYTVVAVCATAIGPWRVQLGPLAIGADVVFKPLSVAVAAAALALAASSRAREAWARRSLLGFYAVATVVMFVCSFGPQPTWRGQQILYQPPYAWLMHLPIFSDEIRVPARFAMLAMLTLAAAAALAFDRLALQRSARRVLGPALMLGILADGWIAGFPTPLLPRLLPAARVAGFDAVVELPLGDGDSQAMYRATAHQHPVVNGTSGYVPPAYGALAAAIREKDDGVLDALAATGRMLVAVNGETDPDHFWRAALAVRSRTTHLGDENGWSLFTIAPPVPLIAPVCQLGSLPVDGATSWNRPAQRAGDSVVLDLGRVAQPCAVVMSLGPAVYAFPRRLSIATSVDALGWTTVFNGSAASETVRAAMEQPTDARLQFSLSEGAARFIRLQLEASQPAVPWLVADVVVRGTN